MRRITRAILFVILSASTGFAAPDNTVYDPLLDGPKTEPSRHRRHQPKTSRGSGFTIGGQVGFYGGSIRSIRTPTEIKLDSGWSPSAGLNLGYRTEGLLEIHLSMDLGLGRSHSSKEPDGVMAVDFMVIPGVLAHLYDEWPFAAYAGLGFLWGEYGYMDGQASQSVIGPNGLLGAAWRSDSHSAIFIEVGGSLAYNRDAKKLIAIPMDVSDMGVSVDAGQWLPLLRVTFGYRLTTF